jgi:hypothetical protein
MRCRRFVRTPGSGRLKSSSATATIVVTDLPCRFLRSSPPPLPLSIDLARRRRRRRRYRCRR